MDLIPFVQEYHENGACLTRTIYINPINVTSIVEESNGICTINTSGGLRQWVQIKGDIDAIAARLNRGLE